MDRLERMRAQLQTARSHSAVARLVREYVKTMGAADLSRIPASCQALLLRAHLAIEASAVALVREELTFRGDAHAHAVLREATSALVAAASRLVQIESRTPSP